MRIHLISTPRNVSTALMYSFAQRADTRVVDEPFYAYYLARSDADHPDREAVLASQPTDPEGVFADLDRLDDRPLLFLKGMAHHLGGVDLLRLAEWKSLFFIRDPKQLIASYAQVIERPTMQDIGSRRMVELFDAIRAAGGEAYVLDSADLVNDPERTLMAVCDRLAIPFDAAMLGWEAGPRPEDGVWAPHWYANVHRSTGFSPQATSTRPLPTHCEELYREALPLYRTLSAHAIRA
ncbi:MAG: sulfotransferase family protein [Flavobacteriales bacterium]|nr:sulfotransferase family protein [Flavobacteriales bacterium]